MDPVIDIMMAAVKAGIFTGGGKGGEYSFTVPDAQDPIHVTIRSTGRASVATSTGAEEEHYDLTDGALGPTALLTTLFERMIDENLDKNAMAFHDMIVDYAEVNGSDEDEESGDESDEADAEDADSEGDDEATDEDDLADDSDNASDEESTDEDSEDAGDDDALDDDSEGDDSEEDTGEDEEASAMPSFTDPEAFLKAIEEAAKPDPAFVAIKARIDVLKACGFAKVVRGVNGYNAALLNQAEVSLLFDRASDKLPLAPRSVVISNNGVKQSLQGGWGDVHRGLAVIKDFYQSNPRLPEATRIVHAIDKLEELAGDDSAPIPKTNAGSIGPTIDSSNYQAGLLELARALGNTQPAGEPTRILVDMTIKTSLSLRLYAQDQESPLILMDSIYSGPGGPRLIMRATPVTSVAAFAEALGNVQRFYQHGKAVSLMVSAAHPTVMAKLGSVIERIIRNADIRTTSEALSSTETAAYGEATPTSVQQAYSDTVESVSESAPEPETEFPTELNSPDPLFADTPNTSSPVSPLNITELLAINGNNRTYQVRRAIAAQVGHYQAYAMFNALLTVAELIGYWSPFMYTQADEWTNKLIVYTRTVYGELAVKEMQGVLDNY